MELDRQRRALEIFSQAVAQASEQRGPFVQQACDGDASLLAAVEALLAQDDSDSLPEATLEPGTPSDSDFSDEVLRRLAGRASAFSRYELQGEIAHGGQGVIVRVWDEDLRRHLAMKVILSRTGSSSAGPRSNPIDERTLGRFLEEAQVTGQLEHPGIVPVHELGLDDEGRVYFTMRLVKGNDLRKIFKQARRGENEWSRTRALNVLLKACRCGSPVAERRRDRLADGEAHRTDLLPPAGGLPGR